MSDNTSGRRRRRSSSIGENDGRAGENDSDHEMQQALASSPQAGVLGSPDNIDFEDPDGATSQQRFPQDLDDLEEQMDEVDLLGDDMYRDYCLLYTSRCA